MTNAEFRRLLASLNSERPHAPGGEWRGVPSNSEVYRWLCEYGLAQRAWVGVFLDGSGFRIACPKVFEQPLQIFEQPLPEGTTFEEALALAEHAVKERYGS